MPIAESCRSRKRTSRSYPPRPRDLAAGLPWWPSTATRDVVPEASVSRMERSCRSPSLRASSPLHDAERESLLTAQIEAELRCRGPDESGRRVRTIRS